MRNVVPAVACMTFIAFSSVASAQTQSSVYVRERFDSGAPQYGFGYYYPPDGSFRFDHMQTGGASGSGAAHLRTLAGREQYGLGWSTRSLGRTFSVGDAVYIRFRVRYDDDHRWVGSGSLQNKFVMMGLTRTATQSRIIIHNEQPHSTSGCTLGFNGDGGSTRWLPRDFGLNYSSWSDPAIAGHWGSLAVKVNISWDCAAPVPVTHGVWYNVQVYAKSGTSNNAEFKMWVNNDNFDAPNSRASGFNLGVDGWDGGLTIGGYQTDAPAYDGGFRLDDLEIGNSFDPAWSSEKTQPPQPPTNVRVE